MPSTRESLDRFLAAVGSRDLRAVSRSLAPQVTWQNVPHPPAVGRDAVLALLGGIVTWSDAVRWDVVSASYDGDVGWLERVDRFVIDGVEHAVPCNGVFRVDADGRLTEVRDYVDLGPWRTEIAPVMERLATRSPQQVVERHLAAVATGDPVRMAADYALDAQLVRGDDVHRGWSAIADYFETVPPRLAGRSVEFVAVDTAADGEVTVRWRLTGDGPAVSGRDRYTITAGRIATQRVELDAADF